MGELFRMNGLPVKKKLTCSEEIFPKHKTYVNRRCLPKENQKFKIILHFIKIMKRTYSIEISNGI